MKESARGLRKVYLRNRLILAEERGDKAAYKGVKQTIKRKESKPMWRAINQSVDDARLGATDHVQRVRPDGSIENITDPEEMNAEIQYIMEQRFDLAHRAQITVSSLAKKLGYLPDRVCTASAQRTGQDSIGCRRHHLDRPGRDCQAGYDNRIIFRRETGHHPGEVPSLLEASAGGDCLLCQ